MITRITSRPSDISGLSPLNQDEDTNEPCHVPVTITTSPDFCPPNCRLPPTITRTVFTPVMLPEFHFIKEVRVLGERYWPISVSDTDKLKSGCLYVKKRTGCLSYKEDPKGKMNLLCRTFSDKLSTSISDTIKTFSEDETVLLYTDLFCTPTSDICSEELHSSLLGEKTQYLPLYTSLHGLLTRPLDDPQLAEQVRLVLGYQDGNHDDVIPERLLQRLRERVEEVRDEEELGTSEMELRLSDVSRVCARDAFYRQGGEGGEVREVLEELSMRHDQETVNQFMSLISIAGC
eukprot:sb/3467654/